MKMKTLFMLILCLVLAVGVMGTMQTSPRTTHRAISVPFPDKVVVEYGYVQSCTVTGDFNE